MGKAADYVCRTKIGAYFYEIRESRKLVLLIVSIALLLDNMLLTIVVPIIPEFLYQMRHANDNVTVHRVGVGRAGFMSHSPGLMASPSPSSRLPSSRPPPVIMTSAPQSTADGAYWVRRKMTTTESPPPSLSPMEMEGMMYPDYPSLPSLPDNDDSSKKKDDDDEDNDEEVYYYYSDQVDMTPAEQQATDLETAKRLKHEELVKENIEVGVMFASKAFVQLIANPFVGPLTNKIGYSVPMFCGFVIMFFSTLLFAFSRSYFILFVARAFQGVGSSCSSVAGMGMLAERYPDDKERGNAMAIALGGLAMGVLIGPPFGGFMYQFVGKSAPFLVLAILALLDGGLQLLVLQPTVIKSDEEAPSLKALISDPYILVASGAITFANMGIAMLEPSLPIFMMDRMDAEKWQLGAAFLPASISYLIGTNLFGPLGHRMGRWLASLLGLCLIGSALILVPFADRPNHLIIPMAGLGFGIGMVDSSMMPELGNLVDIRHSAVYGGVYAIGDIAFCMGFAVGPALSGSLVEGIGFKAMMIGVGIIGICYAPFLVFLHDPPHRTEEEKEESAKIMYGGDKTKVRYNNFDEELVGQPFLNSSGEKTNLGGHGVQGKGI